MVAPINVHQYLCITLYSLRGAGLKIARLARLARLARHTHRALCSASITCFVFPIWNNFWCIFLLLLLVHLNDRSILCVSFVFLWWILLSFGPCDHWLLICSMAIFSSKFQVFFGYIAQFFLLFHLAVLAFVQLRRRRTLVNEVHESEQQQQAGRHVQIFNRQTEMHSCVVASCDCGVARFVPLNAGRTL